LASIKNGGGGGNGPCDMNAPPGERGGGGSIAFVPFGRLVDGRRCGGTAFTGRCFRGLRVFFGGLQALKCEKLNEHISLSVSTQS
jgi:hypothetical protein